MISSISIDKFREIDSLQLQLRKCHKVDVSSGDASLLTMLLALCQSYLPGYAYDWQGVRRPGESGFGNGRLALKGKLFDGGTFAKCLHEDSNYCSGGVEFVIENPEKTDRKRAEADDFRELCRLFGEKYANVKRFALGVETSFTQKSDDSILSYQMVSIRCERVWDEDVTSFFELVLYKNGTNYDLYWEELPDIRGGRTSGRAKGCNVRMRNLAVLDIVSDGVQDGAGFEEMLPSVVRISRIAADQFGTLRFLDVGSQMSAPRPGSYASVQAPVQGSCYYVGVHGEYTEAVIRTYTEEKIRLAWPDPATGEIRHGLFAEAYEAWKKELDGSFREGSAAQNGGLLRAGGGDATCSTLRNISKNKTGSPLLNRTGAEETTLVQGLILRTGETLVLSGDSGLPDKFFDYLSCMGRQVVLIR